MSDLGLLTAGRQVFAIAEDCRGSSRGTSSTLRYGVEVSAETGAFPGQVMTRSIVKYRPVDSMQASLRDVGVGRGRVPLAQRPPSLPKARCLRPLQRELQLINQDSRSMLASARVIELVEEYTLLGDDEQ